MPSDGNNSRSGTTGREDSFLARWSRRKHEAEHGTPTEDTEATGTPAEAEAEASTPGTESPDGETAVGTADTEAADTDLPHPDTLDRDSDFSVYLTKRVSSTFRRAAMRRLFSAPEFNVRDGLDDYDEDYTQFQSLGNTVTAHMRHHAERLRKRDEERAEQAERDAEAERERTAAGPEQEQTTEPDTDATADDPTPAEDAPDTRHTAQSATNRDDDDTT